MFNYFSRIFFFSIFENKFCESMYILMISVVTQKHLQWIHLCSFLNIDFNLTNRLWKDYINSKFKKPKIDNLGIKVIIYIDEYLCRSDNEHKN